MRPRRSGPSNEPCLRRVLPGVRSAQRGVARDIDVFLPASYRESRRRYPVVYMQDGQNLADRHRAFAGTWELEAALETLASRGVEAIVVGIPNMGEARVESTRRSLMPNSAAVMATPILPISNER